MSSDTRTTGAQRVVEYATSEQGRGHAKVGGLGALAGAVAMAIPTIPTLVADHEDRQVCEAALEQSHEQSAALQQSYTMLVMQMADFALQGRTTR